MTQPPLIEISRPGRFTAADGRTWDFSDADLARAVAAYDHENEPAPLVVGHPKMDEPAYGWVASLAIEGGKIVARPEHVNADFSEMVKAKAFRRVSASWYPPAHPQNPRPGAWYLKHVGFLGAAAPSIRGLKPVHFSEEQLADVAFSEAGVLPDAPVSPAEEPIVADTTEPGPVDFAEREAELNTRETDIAAREQAIADREAAAAAADATARLAGHVSFAEGLIAGGKLKPFGKDKIVGLLVTLDSAAIASFGEAGELAPLDVFKELLTAADPFVSFGELAPAEDDKTAVASFAAPSGYSVDGEQMALMVKAKAYQDAHPDVSWIDAVKAVS